MATVSRARPDFYARQRRLFRWAGAVPFDSYRLVLRWDRYGDLARRSDLRRYPGAQRVVIPLTEERYRIRGFDRAEAVEDLFYTFVKQRGRWRIAEDTDLEPVGLPSARHLWDFGPLVATRSAHFQMFRHPCGSSIGCSETSDGVLGLAENALDRVGRYWHMGRRERVVILVPTTTEELARVLQTTFDLDDFVAFAAATVDTQDGWEYRGARILFNPEAIAGRPASQVLTILSHELLHVVTRPASGPFVPVFVEEGVAEYVGYDASPEALGFFDGIVATGGFDGRLPADVEFLTGSGNDIYTSYQKAHSAVRFFVARWGLHRFERFYRRLGRSRVAPGTTEYHLDRALRRTIGIGFDAFERAWANSIR
jgi:hypothetical protein